VFPSFLARLLPRLQNKIVPRVFNHPPEPETVPAVFFRLETAQNEFFPLLRARGCVIKPT
jgi:hypothetical protein